MWRSMSNQLPHNNCYRVTPRLIAGEYPGAPCPAAAQEKVGRHLAAGITFFVDLTEPQELAPYTDYLGPAIYLRVPIRDQSIPTHPQTTALILDVIDQAIARGHTVYIHCWGGIGRTGTVVGCWLVRHGQNGDEALATIACHWQSVEKSWRQPRSPETDEQHAYVRAWREPAG